MMIQRELAVAPFHGGAAALEQIGAFTGDLFDTLANGGGQGLQRMIVLSQWLEQLRTEIAQSVSCLGVAAASGDTLEIQGRNQLLDDSALHGRGQTEGLDFGLQGGEEKGDGGEQLRGQALRFGESSACTRGQIGGFGEALQSFPNVFEALRNAFDRLRLAALQVVGVIQHAELTHQRTQRMQRKGCRVRSTQRMQGQVREQGQVYN